MSYQTHNPDSCPICHRPLGLGHTISEHVNMPEDSVIKHKGNFACPLCGKTTIHKHYLDRKGWLHDGVAQDALDSDGNTTHAQPAPSTCPSCTHPHKRGVRCTASTGLMMTCNCKWPITDYVEAAPVSCGHQLTEYEHNYYANHPEQDRLCKRCAMETKAR